MLEKEAQSRLMQQIASGDEASLGKLYDEFSGTVMAIAMKVLGDRTEAEDLVHDVFIEVWRSAKNFDPDRGSVATWITVITRSRCIDRTRLARWKMRQTYEETSPGGFPADDSVKRPHRRADDFRIRNSVEDLPEDQRDVVILAYFGGYSSSEIAERLEIPLGTVKSRMRLAMNKFRSAFDCED